MKSDPSLLKITIAFFVLAAIFLVIEGSRLRHLLHAKDRLPQNFGIPEPFPTDFIGQLVRPFVQSFGK